MKLSPPGEAEVVVSYANLKEVVFHTDLLVYVSAFTISMAAKTFG
jgi:hypothetical protein